MKKIWVVVVCLAGALHAGAQTAAAGVATAQRPAATQTSFSSANDVLLGIFERQVLGVAKAMPAGKYDFTPASLNIPGAKYDGVQTFAGMAKHLAQANYYFYGTATGTKPNADAKAISSLKTKDEIVSALTQSFAFAHTALPNLTAENQNDPLDVDGVKSKGTLAAFALAHGYDHYGQMVEYLRMNGIIPPGSK